MFINIIIYRVLFSGELLLPDAIFSREYTIEVPHLDLIAFTKHSQTRYRVRHVDKLIQDHKLYAHALVLYIPGWWNTPTDESTQTITKALLSKHRMILVLDTRLSFCRGYIGAASRVRALARFLYDIIVRLDIKGVPLENIHLIGFSLGAHVAGITGKLVRNRMRRKLLRITALDPAKPCFSRSTNYRLDKNDAKFVQVLHTSTGVLGLEQPIGHADVYMNGITGSQPECSDRRFSLECDHAQAWKAYSASVMNEGHLMGHRCNSWEDLKNAKCFGNETILGYGCNLETRGLYLHKSNEVFKRNANHGVKNFGIFDWIL